MGEADTTREAGGAEGRVLRPSIAGDSRRRSAFVTDLLKQKHVLVVHGSGFGEKTGTRHMRIVFLPPEPVLSEAYDKITDFMKERYK